MQRYVLKNEPIISFCHLHFTVKHWIVHLTNYPKQSAKCIQQSPCSEKKTCSHIVKKLYYGDEGLPFHNSQPRVTILRQSQPLHDLPSYSFQINFPLTAVSSIQVSPLNASSLSYVPHAPPISPSLI
jgi:hypothetical protein